MQIPPENASVGGSDTQSHRAAHVRLIGLDDEPALDSSLPQPHRERTKLRLIWHGECDGVGAYWKVAGRGLARSVDQLRGLGANRKVGADDAEVRQVRTVNVMCS